MIVLKTNYGPITFELDFEKAPKSAANFLQYAKDGFYDGTVFHRVINDFMVQGGGFASGMEKNLPELPSRTRRIMACPMSPVA
tara:strand:- start:3812 stop:4060 length:249 start_codon:yes stop_codon:yes gene_type:complete